MQRQRGFDQASDAGGRVKMTDVGFKRTDRTVIFGRRTGAKGPGQRFDFNGISQRRARAVGFDVTDGLGREASHGLRGGDDLGLAFNARRSVANFIGTVVVDGETLDDGVDRVPIRQRVFEPLQEDDADAIAWHRTRSLRVERAAVPIRGPNSAFLEKITALLRKGDGDGARQRHVALVIEQILARHTDRDERSGAGGLDGQAGSAQVQLVGNARGQKVLVVAEHHLMFTQLRH